MDRGTKGNLGGCYGMMEFSISVHWQSWQNKDDGHDNPIAVRSKSSVLGCGGFFVNGLGSKRQRCFITSSFSGICACKPARHILQASYGYGSTQELIS